MKRINNIIVVWVICFLNFLCVRANIIDDIEITRREFEFPNIDKQSENVQIVKVYSEKDFLKEDTKQIIVFVLQNDISISSTVCLLNNKNYYIKGNGYRISEAGYKERILFPPIKTLSWSIDSINKIAIFRLPFPIEKDKHINNDSVFINYEAWFLRFKGKLVYQSDTSVACLCDEKCMSNIRFKKYTPSPYIFLEIMPKKKNMQSLFKIGRKSRVLIENVFYTKVNSLCIFNNGYLKIVNSYFQNVDNGCVKSSGELYLKEIDFFNIQSSPVYSLNQSYLDIEHSNFKKIGLIGSNEACVVSRGNCFISHNHFEDYNYSAIRVGCVNVDNENKLPLSCIEYNTLVWTKDWTNLIDIYGLKDSGAIYITTNNKICVVRDNIIINFGGHGLNRAIFCDDGAYNMYIYNNFISGTQNSYDIDSRDCSKINTHMIPKGFYMNSGNFIGFNVCDGYLRLCESSTRLDNGCLFIHNVLLDPLKEEKCIIKNRKGVEVPIVNIFDSKKIKNKKVLFHKNNLLDSIKH